MSQVAAVKVFEIQELASLVIRHLTRRDLCTCAMVNRAWHEAIIPILYHSVIIDGRHALKGSTGICWDGFQKHSSHMRRLKIDNRAKRDISLFGFNCTNLTILHLVISKDPGLTQQWSLDLLKMIANNPDISTLQLTSLDDPRFNVIDRHLVELGLLRYMPGLKKLSISSTRIGERSVNEVMRCAHRLEELNLDTTRIFKDEIPGSWKLSGNRFCYIRRDWTPLVAVYRKLVADLSLKDHDDAVDAHDGPYILDSQGRKCRQGTSLKKFRFILKGPQGRCPESADASPLLRLCCSAEYILLNITGQPTRGGSLLALRDQVDHPAWRLKHLYIGPVLLEESPALVEILRASKSLLISFRLLESCLTDELLEALLQNHGNTLQRVTFDRCPAVLRQDRIEAVLSRCPNLQSLDVFNYKRESTPHRTLPGERQLRWTTSTTSNGKVFRVFALAQVLWGVVKDGGSARLVSSVREVDAKADLWTRVKLMYSGQIQNHLRFIAN